MRGFIVDCKYVYRVKEYMDALETLETPIILVSSGEDERNP